MRLLRRRAPEESSTVHNRVDALNRNNKGVRIQEVAFNELHLVAQQSNRSRSIAHQSSNVMILARKALGEPAADFSGRTGDEDFHDLAVVFHDFLHGRKVFFNRGDKAELVAAAVEVVAGTLDFEISVALQIVG